MEIELQNAAVKTLCRICAYGHGIFSIRKLGDIKVTIQVLKVKHRCYITAISVIIGFSFILIIILMGLYYLAKAVGYGISYA